MIKKDEYAVVVDDGRSPWAWKYDGQKVLVLETDSKPWCKTGDGETHAFYQTSLKPIQEKPMKDKFVLVPHNDILRKAVQDQAFALGFKWYSPDDGIYRSEWMNNDCLKLHADGNKLLLCSRGFAIARGYEELTLSEFFSLKEKEPDFFERAGHLTVAEAMGFDVTINELADAIISKAMAKLRESK